MSGFSKRIMEQKYSHNLPDGSKETWEQIADRVATNVMDAAGFHPNYDITNSIRKRILEKKFIPGGRYLYASGRPLHQVQNCVLLRAEDSREGWSDHLHKNSMALMTGAGVGTVYSDIREEGALIKRTGGQATGPLALMQMTNECGRGIMQGGSRRSALWAGLHWSHKDAFKFVRMKDWNAEVKAAKAKDYNAPAPMDGTNISVILDNAFFSAYNNPSHEQHSQAHAIYWETVRHMLETAEPGFSVDCGENEGENLRNAPVTGGTRVLTPGGYAFVSDIVGKPTQLWTGVRWSSPVEFNKTKENSDLVQVQLSNGRSIACDPDHPFMVRQYIGAGKNKTVKVERVAARDLTEGDKIASDLPSQAEASPVPSNYGYGFVFGDGSISNGRGDIYYHTPNKEACYARACAGLEAHSASIPNRAYFKTPYNNKEEMLTYRLDNSFVAGWFDADGSLCRDLLRLSCSTKRHLRILQEYLDSIGIKSVVRKDGHSGFKPDSKSYTLLVLASSIATFAKLIPTTRLIVPIDHVPYRESEIYVKQVIDLDVKEDVYCVDVQVPEHSFMAEGVLVSNCTEITSRDDSDICNLGSINMANIDSLEDMRFAVLYGTIFLLAGTLYSDLPYAKIGEVRTKNRRLGLGLMGLHEWLLKRGKTYGPDEELAKYMEAYTESTQIAKQYAAAWGISSPIKTRAIAPTGTIGILANTTTGVEPIFCVAYKRRYLKGSVVNYEYVIDPTANRLIESGAINADQVEDAYSISPERRIAFQAWLQTYVDHGISSTINLPAWGSEANNESRVQEFGEMLMKYLPKLRGITTYPDGARSGQPLSPVKYTTAVKHVGQVFIEGTDICDLTKSGTCGS